MGTTNEPTNELIYQLTHDACMCARVSAWHVTRSQRKEYAYIYARTQVHTAAYCARIVTIPRPAAISELVDSAISGPINARGANIKRRTTSRTQQIDVKPKSSRDTSFGSGFKVV